MNGKHSQEKKKVNKHQAAIGSKLFRLVVLLLLVKVEV